MIILCWLETQFYWKFHACSGMHVPSPGVSWPLPQRGSRKMLMFGAKKVSPACPILCIARASVEMTSPIAWIRDLHVHLIKFHHHRACIQDLHVEGCTKSYNLWEGGGRRSLCMNDRCSTTHHDLYTLNKSYISTKVDSWWSCHSMQCLRPPLVGRNLQTINAGSRISQLSYLILCLQSSN